MAKKLVKLEVTINFWNYTYIKFKKIKNNLVQAHNQRWYILSFCKIPSVNVCRSVLSPRIYYKPSWKKILVVYTTGSFFVILNHWAVYFENNWQMNVLKMYMSCYSLVIKLFKNSTGVYLCLFRDHLDLWLLFGL